MPSLIEKLKNEGVLKGYWDFRAGHYQDLSGNGNHGTAASGAYLTRDGLKNISGSSVTVADSNSLDITEGCFVILGNPTRKTTEMWLGKDAAAADLDYRIYSDTVNFAITDSTNTARGLNFNFSGSNCIALNVKSGETGSVYSNGIFAGNLSGVSTFTAGTKTLYLGTAGYSQTVPAKRPVKAILIISKQLTATEHAQIYDELSKMRWPRKIESTILSSLYQDSDTSKIIATWDIGTTAGKLVDLIGGHDGTAVNGPTLAKTKFGLVPNFIGAKHQHYTLTGDSDFQRGEFTLEFLMKQPSAVAATQTIFSSGGLHYFLGINVSNQPFFYCLQSDLSPLSVAGTTPFVPNAWNHVIFSVKGDATNLFIKCFINGVRSLDTRGSLGWSSVYSSNFIIGSYDGSSFSYDGLLKPLGFYSESKSDEWMSDRFRTFSKTVLYTENNGLSVSTGNKTSGSLENSNFKINSGTWKISIDEGLNKNTKVAECVVAGAISRPVNKINGTGENAYGTWEFWMKKKPGNTAYFNFCSQTAAGFSVGDYYLEHNSSNEVHVGLWGTGPFLSGTTTSDSWHKFVCIRNSNGVFELYVDDRKIGEATDTSLTANGYIVIDLDAGDKFALTDPINRYSLTKYIGSIRP